MSEETPVSLIPDGIPAGQHDPKNPFIFKGTEGKMNYVLVAQKGPVILGVRVLVQHFTKDKCVVGFRIRSTQHPNQNVTIAPGVFGSAWGQDVQFTKNVQTHSSFMMMTELNMPPGQWDQLPAAMKKGRVVSKLINWLAQNIDTEDLAYEQDELVQILWDQVAKQVKIKELQGEIFEGMVDEDGEPLEATIDPEAPLQGQEKVVHDMALKHLQEQGATINEDGSVTMPDEEEPATTEEFSDNIDALLAGFSEDDEDDSGLLPN